jgi:hypothetical protein
MHGFQEKTPMMLPNHKDLITSLSDAGARFLVVGGYAVGSYGYARYTGDLDVWIDTSSENVDIVWRVLVEFGAPMGPLKPEDLKDPNLILQLGIPPERVDILCSVSGLLFEKAWEHRQVRDVMGLAIPFLSKQDLIDNKRATGRPKDLADIDWLEKH